MSTEVKVPQLPESITDATVSTWYKKVGDKVTRDENLVDLETDKVMLEVPAPADGVLQEIKFNTGDTVKAQAVIAIIGDGDAKSESSDKKDEKADKEPAKKEESAKTEKSEKQTEEKSEPKSESKAAAKPAEKAEPKADSDNLSPSARRRANAGDEKAESKSDGKSESKSAPAKAASTSSTAQMSTDERMEKRVPMTRIRARIAERLLEVTQTTAMLTTFNEVNMAPVMAIRAKYKDRFEKKYNVRLGFMSFFVRACVEALKRSPLVNASIDGNDVVYHGFFDIGVAVSTERGLIVPVLRDADQLEMAEIESKIVGLAEKARVGKLSLEEMQGGTFTITNGGVFGSLLSTPILNAPQSAILGMHKIQERPVVENGEIVIRPMMYLALSYDHRIIDGKESVSFLVNVKELLEDPTRLLLEV